MQLFSPRLNDVQFLELVRRNHARRRLMATVLFMAGIVLCAIAIGSYFYLTNLAYSVIDALQTGDSPTNEQVGRGAQYTQLYIGFVCGMQVSMAFLIGFYCTILGAHSLLIPDRKTELLLAACDPAQSAHREATNGGRTEEESPRV